ncbi:ADP-ribosylglycohydrolase [Butyrivibrio sp. ob235]|uniref:ADP-ribosylglycohydrolase family protein n=1 Tax=Butyrivibrio sp. ob235 TaxID=1761780 RepID=UPI0008D56A2D|nr:ADP-ribosylglycohydrolase family protein [Butyrivibrio sp. ob235]SEM02153.1 ADP-ribosylglycohydrolase [Butyrivibrio sp. ob235]
MYGAILGDVAGSIYEFDAKTHRIQDLTEHIKHSATVFTDDTVMTVAIADALMHAGDNADDSTIQQRAVINMRYWGTEYSGVGYGYMFNEWLYSENPKPYGSYGNGAAMRISPVGWMYDSLEKTLHVAELVTAVTHDNKGAVDGAKAVSAAIFLARNGHSKQEIREYIERTFHYELDKSIVDLVNPMQKNIKCRTAVIQSLIAFFESESLDDAISKAIFIGGDTDTLACITGSIAEAYYGYIQNAALKSILLDKLPENIKRIADEFESKYYS